MERMDRDQWSAKDVARLLALLEDQRRYYQDIIAALPVAVAALAGDRSLISCNRAFRQLVSMRIEDLRGKTIEQVLPSDALIEKIRDLEEQVKMLSTVRERIEAVALQGRGVEDLLAEAITKDFDARYGGDSEQFISNAYQSMWWSRLRGIVA